MTQTKRKLKITNAEFNNDGVLVRVGGTYNKYEERFYDVEKHYE